MAIVVGLMSGTSVDGIDAALVEITGEELTLNVQFLAGETYLYPPKLREQILNICSGAPISMEQLGDLDDAIASEFAQAVQKIQKNQPKAHLIGSHGQTVFHRPPKRQTLTSGNTKLGYSFQLGRGDLIAYLTQIPTVNNFRAADIALEGQGAPIVPRVDAYLLSHPQKTRCIQNLGGIGNVTYLPPSNEENWQEKVLGWDTGPGNMLLDLAIQKLTFGEKKYDQDGSWAAQGKPCEKLVKEWLKQDFFHEAPPKSTGRELFGYIYLQQRWAEAQKYNLTEADWLATLTELTAASVAYNYREFLPKMPDEVLLCGGGARNHYLKKRLAENLAPAKVLTTDEVGLNSDFKEAIAFAVLAYWRYYSGAPGNLPKVTGAKSLSPLGEIHPVL